MSTTFTSNKAHAMQWAREAVQVRAITNQYYNYCLSMIPAMNEAQLLSLGTAMFNAWHEKTKQNQLKLYIVAMRAYRSALPKPRPNIP